MFKYVNAEYDMAVSEASPVFGYYLRSNTGSLDDILVYGKSRGDVLDCGEMILSAFRDATDIDYRKDWESDELAEFILDYAKRCDAKIASDNPNISDEAYDPDNNEIITEDADGVIIRVPVQLVRIARGNFRI